MSELTESGERNPPTITTIAVMAGGSSQRMGQDKAAMVISGATMLEKITSEALRTGSRVVIVGRSHSNDWKVPGVEFLPDETPGLGPLGGVATALRSTGTSILALACDMPLLTTGAIQWLQDTALHSSGEDGLVITMGGEPEPLFSIYHRNALPEIERRLAEGRRAVKGLIEQGRFAFCEAPDWVAVQLRNVNTPEDVERLMGE